MRPFAGKAPGYLLVNIAITLAAQAALCDTFAERSKTLLGWAAAATQTDPKYGFLDA